MYNFSGKKAAYFTLGCKLNFAETSTVGRQLKEAGVTTAAEGEAADICIVNTCSVTEVADAKCRQAISRMVRRHPGALVIVTGCYAQLKPEQVAALDGVDLVLGAEQKGDILRHIAERIDMMPEERALLAHGHETVRTADIRTFVPSCSCGDRTRYFLKVQDGCNYYCTYCTIPMARGRSRNGSIAGFCMSVNLWGRMVVNSKAQRFFNEGYMPYQATVALSRTEDGIAWALGDSKFAGAALLDTSARRPICRATHVTLGRIVDLAIKDMNNMGAAMAPAAADTLRRHLMDTGRTAADYDLIISGDLGKIGHDLLLTLMMDAGVPLDAARYVDCGMLIFSPEQDVHAGGSGCGCSASVLCGYIMRLFREKAIHRVAFMATGALLSPTFSQQGGAIPGIAHLIVLEADEA